MILLLVWLYIGFVATVTLLSKHPQYYLYEAKPWRTALGIALAIPFWPIALWNNRKDFR